MQDFTLEQCEYYAGSGNYTLRDRRDNNSYTVRYINGTCWMTQNLRIAGGTRLTSTYSNVSSSYTIPTTDLTSGDSATSGRIHNSGNTTNGYWYNFCAASAGTVCTDSSSFFSNYDICPAGWRLPTTYEFRGINSYISAFSPVGGGYYRGGSLGGSMGIWWVSGAHSVSNFQHAYGYNNGQLTSWSSAKADGNYIRCVRSS